MVKLDKAEGSIACEGKVPRLTGGVSEVKQKLGFDDIVYIELQ